MLVAGSLAVSCLSSSSVVFRDISIVPSRREMVFTTHDWSYRLCTGYTYSGKPSTVRTSDWSFMNVPVLMTRFFTRMNEPVRDPMGTGSQLQTPSNVRLRRTLGSRLAGK